MELETNTNMCRCCATEGTFKDVKTAYQWMGEEEVYSDMLRECFDVCLMETGSGDDGGICEVCITQLRNASNFKRQVLYTESQFKLRLQNKESKGYVVKLEPEHAEDSNESDNDATGDYDPDFDIKAEDEPKPKRPKRGTTTITLKKAKKTAGETSGKRHDYVFIKKEIEDVELNEVEMEIDTKVTNKRVSSKGLELEQHRSMVREILICTNATPIRSHNGIGYSCCFCADRYPNAADLKQHTIDGHDDKQKLDFMKGRDLSKFYVKLDITSLICNLCNESIESVEALFEHLKDVHEKSVCDATKRRLVPFKFDGGENLKCSVCANSFHSFRVLVEHMNKHYRNYVCKDCDAGFVSQSILFQHVKTHKLGSFKCDYCTKEFVTLLKKRSHERIVHTHTNVMNKCGYCAETFKDYWTRLKHLSAVHGVSTPVFKCQACDKTFHQQKSLRIHTKRDHLMERPHACDQCDKRFFTAKKLSEHKVTHTGLREFQCQVCLKCYGRKKTLNQHMRIHDVYCKYRCEKCSQGFVQKNSWSSHMRIKHGEQV